MKKISLLGSTGSIGQSTLRVIDHLNDSFKVVALAAKSNIDILEQQARLFSPTLIAVYEENKAFELKKRLPDIEVVSGMEGLLQAATLGDVDIVVSAMTGNVGIGPTLAAIKAGKRIALANKEALVSAGELIMRTAQESNSQIIPIDSEHSALFQCLEGRDMASVRRMILTASGGPFLRLSEADLTSITVEQALNHPNWRMGPKITIDCSTLMNKGLEAIEAHWLFNVPMSQIEIVIHPQSVIHSMIEMIDGSILAQLSEPNMIFPIQYALTYPERKQGISPPFDFTRMRNLEFNPPDRKRFACLDLAYHAIAQGGTSPCYLNAANEILVDRFLQGKIAWKEIALKLEKLLLSHTPERDMNIEMVLAVDACAREQARLI